MIKIDYKAVKKIFHCNGVYDGKSFYLIESFKYFSGIGEKTYEKIRDYITLK